jgi:putative ABC transport system permease protein
VKTYATNERKFLTYILVKGKPGVPLKEITARITRETGLAAHTADDFKSMTVTYMVNNTSIVAFFGLMVFAGFFVGAVVTGQMFYNFTFDNLRYFSVFKAMGTTDGTLRRMIFLQASFVGITGFGIGAGVLGLFSHLARGIDLAIYLRWELLAACPVVVLLMCILAALISIRKVMKLEPAAVFNG